MADIIDTPDTSLPASSPAPAASVEPEEQATEPVRLPTALVYDPAMLDHLVPEEFPETPERLERGIALIEALIDSGHAYQANGDVYFRVRSFDGYGKLSNRDPEEMDQGEEAGTASLKEDALDLALWKARQADEDNGWPSPWGRRRVSGRAARYSP